MRCPPEDTRDYSGFALSSHRMLALREVDNATFSWFHFRVCLIAGVGFFTDAYDIFSINIASTMLQFVYAGSVGGNIEQAAVKAAAPLGTLIGQLVFGWLADKIGRKRMYGIELIIIIIGTFGQSLAANGDIGTVNIFSVLIVWRFIMGLGIGGDYPLSAVISSEFASTHIRGRMLTAVFANQGWGQFASTLVATAVVSAFQRSFTTTQLGASLTDPLAKAHLMRAIDRAWRVLVGFGCVPAAAALWFRLTIPETPRFTMDVERNVQQAIADIDEFIKTGAYAFDPDSVVVRVVAPRATWKDFRQWFGRWEEAKVLLGCAYAWFAIDVIFYGLGLNTTKFFTAIGFSSPLTCNTLQADSTAHQAFTDFQNLIIANMVLSAAGLIPGYWATFLFIDRLGRKRIQLLGFGMLTVLFVGMGSSFSTLLKGIPQCVKDTSLFAIPRGAKGFLSLFILASFFQNFGPNTTTFVIPAENFPTRYRSTCHGICAASGKIGAIVSQFAFESVHARNILFAYIPFSVTGFLATLLVRETKQMSLENIHGEESDRFISGLVRPHPGSKVTHHYATSSV
ncbi:phosphate transporter [Trametopsis cervina]|nr:phosphate transporter [Trametopsis cervina]